jgi:small-conductance mechanosensitive channel
MKYSTLYHLFLLVIVLALFVPTRVTGQSHDLREIEKVERIGRLVIRLDSVGKDTAEQARIRVEMDSLKRSLKGYPVVVMNDTLFKLYSRFGVMSAQERASLISKKIVGLAKDYMQNPDSIKIQRDGLQLDIWSGPVIIMAVSIKDSWVAGVSEDSLAKSYLSAIRKSIISYRNDTSLSHLFTQIGLSLLLFIVLILVLKFATRLFRLLDEKVIRRIKTPEKWHQFGDTKILSAERIISFLLFISRMVRYFTYILAVYFTLLIAFSIFPATKPITVTLLSYVLKPVRSIGQAIIKYIPNFVTIIVIYLIFHYLTKGLKYLANEINRGTLNIPGFYPDWAKPTFNIVRFLLFAFMIVMIFPYLPGSDSDIFKGVTVFIGVVFSLGSTSVIGNLVAGMVITYMRSFFIGDVIRIGDHLGTVVEKTPFVIRMRTPKNEYISIPNSVLLTSNIINYSSSKEKGLVLYTSVTIGYDAPWETVHRLLVSAAEVTEYILKDPAPFVLQTSLDDFFVTYQLNAFTDHPEIQTRIYSELHQNIQNKFNEGGVEIMSPHYTSLRNGNKSTIPETK